MEVTSPVNEVVVGQAELDPINVQEPLPNGIGVTYPYEAYEQELFSCSQKLDEVLEDIETLADGKDLGDIVTAINAAKVVITSLIDSQVVTKAELAAVKTLVEAIPTTEPATAQNVTDAKLAIIAKINEITFYISSVAKEATLTSTRTTLLTAISALQGSNEQATLTAIYTIVGAITSGLTDADKTWLLQQFAAIDLSAITSRLDNSTYGLSALKTAIESITFDTSTLAQRTDVKDGNDTAISVSKDVRGRIGASSDTSSAASLFGKIADVKASLPTIPTDYAKAGQVAQTLDDIQIDTSSLAKQGSNTSATNTAIYSAVQGIVIPTGLATEANATANKNAILAAMPSEATLKPLYAARAETNNDGTDTYTIVFPYTAQVVETSTDITITV